MNGCFFCCWFRNLLQLVFACATGAAVGAVAMFCPIFVITWVMQYFSTGHGRGGFAALLAALVIGGLAGWFIRWLFIIVPPSELLQGLSFSEFVFGSCQRGGWFAPWPNRQTALQSPVYVPAPRSSVPLSPPRPSLSPVVAPSELEQRALLLLAHRVPPQFTRRR